MVLICSNSYQKKVSGKKGEMMFNVHKIFVYFFSISFIHTMLYAWGPTELNNGPEKRQATNFYGVLMTYQGTEPVSVDGITINKRIRQIPVYERPVDLPEAEKKVVTQAPQQEEEQTHVEISLTKDPTEELALIYLDLKDVRQIRVDDHHRIWVYAKKKEYSKQKYIEIIVTLKNGTQTAYLIDKKTIIHCDRQNGPEEIVPIQALKTLDIKGYCMRDETGKCPVGSIVNGNNNEKKVPRKKRTNS